MNTKKKPREVHMLVSVPRIDGLTAAQHLTAVRDALRQTSDFYGRRVTVKPAKATTSQGEGAP